MHPILADRRRLGLYLLAWVPVAAFLAAVMAITQEVDWFAASALAFPAATVFAFVCLAAWYPCRALPLSEEQGAKLALTHLLSAAVAAGAFVILGHLISESLASAEWFAPVEMAWAKLVPVEFMLGVLLYLFSVTFHYHMVMSEEASQRDRSLLEAEVRARVAELKALKAQVHPHFLFNSLNAISSLTTSEPETARDMCVKLAGFLRRSLTADAAELLPLADEVALARDYLSVEQVRFGKRLQVEIDTLDDLANQQVPPLILQPLVENAIQHGISHCVSGGTVTIRAERSDDALVLTVTNPIDREAPHKPGDGIGLENVRQRLAALSQPGSLETRKDDHCYVAVARIPVAIGET